MKSLWCYGQFYIVQCILASRTFRNPSITFFEAKEDLATSYEISYSNITKNYVRLEEYNIVYPTDIHKGTVIFLHGQGLTGRYQRMWMKSIKPDLESPHIKFLFPCAPRRPYANFEKQSRNIWFDRTLVKINETENLESYEPSIRGLKQIILNETEQGIPLNKIVIGGYQMGGSMALHMAYRVFPQLAGVFAFTAFLNRNSSVYSSLKKLQGQKVPPMYMTQGREPAVGESKMIQWSKETFYELMQLGVDGDFVIIGDKGREISKEQLDALWCWIQTLI